MADIKVSEMQSTTNLNPDDLIMVVQSGSNKKATFDLFKEIPIDNLNSTSTTDALSANQGKILNDSITNINSKITSLTTYSTEEQRIGTWTDGKPLYRKVFQLGSAPNSTTKSYNIGINCNTITKAFVYLKETSQFINLPFVSLSDSTNNMSYSFSSNYLSVSANKDRSNFNVIAIVEYTKTTD